MISIIHGSIYVKRCLGWWVTNPEPWRWRRGPTVVSSVYEDMRFQDLGWFLWGMGTWRATPLQGLGPPPTSDPTHCCPPAMCQVTQGLVFGTYRLSPLIFKGSLVQQPLSWVVHDSGNDCVVAKEKGECCNNSLQSAASFLPAGSEIRGRTHPRAIAMVRQKWRRSPWRDRASLVGIQIHPSPLYHLPKGKRRMRLEISWCELTKKRILFRQHSTFQNVVWVTIMVLWFTQEFQIRRETLKISQVTQQLSSILGGHLTIEGEYWWLELMEWKSKRG